MKLQGMSIVFALVIVPIMLVLNYYIGLQVDTIKLQTEYDQKLLDSTYDAMSAFELNTANEDLSTVSDSLRTIIEASYNVFINNLATNMGISNANKTYVEPYIPAVLYTLYDGYYICAPSNSPTVLTDSNGNAVAVGDRGVSGSPGNYKYTEPVANDDGTYPEATSSDYLDITELGNSQLEYGQLLYLKEGSTDTYTANIEEAKLETKNVLKTYMPYSARYTDNTFYDLTIIYTLDNFVTIEGNIGNVYYTKSGYLIPDGSVAVEISNQPDGYSNNIYDYNQNDIQELIEDGGASFKVTIKKKNESGAYIEDVSYTQTDGTSEEALNNKLNILNNALEEAQELYYSSYFLANNTARDSAISKYTNEYFEKLAGYGLPNWSNVATKLHPVTTTALTASEVGKILKDDLISEIEEEINNVQYELDKMSSIVYYAKAAIFSRWVQEYLCTSDQANGKCNVIENDLTEVSGQKYATIKGVESLEFNFETGAQVFNLSGTEPVSATEIATDCPFYQHKLNVIQMSIQYNLNLAMSVYNQNETYSFDYEMPVIQSDEWEQILTNISITTFMQGIKCGLKTYNNYKIVSSTNNDILTLPEEIYYVRKEDFNDEESEYHRINCSELIKINSENANAEYMAFSSKEVKYDKIYNKNRDYMTYEYDHKNYACYDCINDRNYFNRDTDSDGENDDQINIFDSSDANYDSYKNLRKAYYIGVAKERNDTYKMNAFENSEGYEILMVPGGSATTGSLPANKIKSIEVAVGTIYSQNSTIKTALYTFNYNMEENLSNDSYSVATNNSSNNSTQTVTIDVLSGKNLGDNKFQITALSPQCKDNDDIKNSNGDNATTQFRSAIKYIKIIYK